MSSFWARSTGREINRNQLLDRLTDNNTPIGKVFNHLKLRQIFCVASHKGGTPQTTGLSLSPASSGGPSKVRSLHGFTIWMFQWNKLEEML